MKKVDIVIPIHNRPEHTKQTLESLFANTNPDLYNLYIVDDASDDETLNVLHGPLFANNYALCKHNQEAIGPAASRNWMTTWITDGKKRSKYLYHSDNDVYFKPGWLETMLEVFEKLRIQDHVKLLGGGCHPYLQNNRTINHLFTKEQLNDPILKGPHSVYGCSCGATPIIGIKDAVSGYSQLMTWETWDKYGPFDEGSRGQEKKIAGSEDWAFCQRIIKDGFLVGSLEPEVVIHTGRTNTYNEPATGAEVIKDQEGVMVK